MTVRKQAFPADAGEAAIVLRHPGDADHQRVVRVADDWFGRPMRRLLPRLWFRHFSGTSWLAERSDGSLAGFLVGFRSADDPGEAVVLLVGVDPNLRRLGIGRSLVERFAETSRIAGANRASTIAWPDEPRAIRFLEAVGFRPDADRNTARLYGVPAVPDYEGDREDRALFVRDL